MSVYIYIYIYEQDEQFIPGESPASRRRELKPPAAKTGSEALRLRGGQISFHATETAKASPSPYLLLGKPPAAITGSEAPAHPNHEALMGPRSRNACDRTGYP